jgi:hypothetical protein
VDIGLAVVADQETFEVVEPGKGAFDHRAMDPQAGAVLGPSLDKEGLDVSLSHFTAVAVMVIASIGKEAIGPRGGRPTRPPTGVCDP